MDLGKTCLYVSQTLEKFGVHNILRWWLIEDVRFAHHVRDFNHDVVVDNDNDDDDG